MTKELSPFQKGIDFARHFAGRTFTLHDIMDRYDCTYRQAVNLRLLAESVVKISPCGTAPHNKRGSGRNLWKIQ